tara:strand:- start:279 stop:482 length:204 start_codon:yes stop_codon:yes gene_type:complete
MGIREYDFDSYNDIELQNRIKEREIQKIALEKNNQELNQICKKYCLCIGWIFVLFLFCWIVALYLQN